MKAVDRTGQRHGQLTIVGRAPFDRPIKGRKAGRILWNTICDCGNPGTPTEYCNLSSGRVTSCGCAKRVAAQELGVRRRSERVGKRYGDYEVVALGTTARTYKVRCSLCGTEREVDVCSLSATEREQRMPVCCSRPNPKYEVDGFSSSQLHRLYNDYRSNAEKRTRSFTLTPNEFEKLVKAPCAYCGSTPESAVRFVKPSERRKVYVPVNGVDRVDNSVGYEPANCVTCCQICNRSKTTLSPSDFQTWIDRLVAFQTAKGAASPAS